MLDLQALQVLESLVLPGSEKVDLRDAKEVRPPPSLVSRPLIS